ncbi:hypothetical protein DC20_06675 [Rufibacter tibetensis]|uniref:Uncharacterized protein n=1 Tax=Rufibacter tibetensis TaxID=512763 RepID=A0A0P0CUN1_9BACT|nr:hypothetical protein DC20_06675 [Rufibacter tibetensis]
MSLPEKLALAQTFGLVVLGIVASYIDTAWFEEVYTVEDGFVEWLTVLPLVVVIAFCLSRIIGRKEPGSVRFMTGTILIVLFSFFVAGEEISWGQRIFQVQSTGFFKENNSQQEMNLHNMVINGVKVNKVIFSQALTVGAAFYLLALPLIYRKSRNIKELIDGWAVPVPRLYQIISFLLLFGVIGLCPSGKRAELLEMGATTLFCLIVLCPFNPIQSDRELLNNPKQS